MSVVLTEKAETILADLPPYLADEPLVQSIVDVCARELQRIEDAATAIRTGLFPATATDEYDLLALWETLLGLPVKPSGASVEERQTIVLANIRRRNASSGADWVELITQALGGSEWEHEEGPGPYQVTIRIPYAPGSYNTALVEALARRVTPAHLEIQATYNEGFILGYDVDDPNASLLDQDLL